jgi:hypothetical protein
MDTNPFASKLPPLPPEFQDPPVPSANPVVPAAPEQPAVVPMVTTQVVQPQVQPVFVQAQPVQQLPTIPQAPQVIITNSPQKTGRSNTVLTIITTIFTLLVIVIVVVSVQLVRSLETTVSGLQVELASTNSNRDELQRRIDFLSVSNADLQNKVLQTREENSATPSACDLQLVSVGVADYRIPCRWQSFFEIKYTALPESRGYLNDTPITTVLSAPVTNTVKGIVNITRFSPALGNAQADPLTGIIKGDQTAGKTATQLTNSAGTTLYEVKPFVFAGVDRVRYYAQKTSGTDVYLFFLEYAITDAEPMRTVVDSFTWKI